MRISFSAMNRILEEKIATDEAYRNSISQHGKIVLAAGRALSDEALLGKLAAMGLGMDRVEFLRRTRSCLSAQEMAEAVYDDPPRRLSNSESDWVWIAFTCLWERWSPERPSFEMIDDRMQEGYLAQERRDEQAACRLWMETWKGIWAVVEARQLDAVEDFDELFCGTNSLFNWLQDFLLELHNAGLREKAFLLERRAVLETLIGRLELGRLLPNCRKDLAETYFSLGLPDQAEKLFRQWLQETPRWGWGWIGLADGYTFEAPDEMRDLARAEHILKQGRAGQGVEERQYLLQRLGNLYKKTGRAGEAKAVQEELQRLEKRSPALMSTPALPTVAAAPTMTAGKRQEGRKTPMWLLGERTRTSSAHRVGRNDPCPCGSGKKFKKCCGLG
jgi:tetratricopeptide (TPR) repeat protein